MLSEVFDLIRFANRVHR